MNLPIKVLNSNTLSYESKIKHQILSKKYFKYQKKLISAGKEVFSSQIFDKDTSININKKEEIIKWLNQMDITSRIKTFSIENKWLSSMIQQMFFLIKRDPNVRFKYNKEEILINEELKNVMYPFQLNNNPFNQDLMFALDQFFVYKGVNEYSYSDLCLTESRFCQEIRFFDSEEFNDIITFSANSLTNIESFFNNFINKFTKNRAFTKMCKVSYDMFNNFYYWNYPEWFDITGYNSLAEIFLAYVEQIICIKYWIFETSLLNDKPEKILSLNFMNDMKFKDIFDKRDNIKQFLEEQFTNQKDKLFNEKISLTNVLKDLKNDQNIVSKVKYRKNESKSCFYPRPHSPKDIFQSSMYKSEIYLENEMIDSIKKSYANLKEINFIDEIMFSDVNRLNTIKDFLYKAIFDCVYNLYTEKNANDLLNENTIVVESLISNDKIKKKQKQKNVKKKKNDNPRKKSLSEIKKQDKVQTKDGANTRIIITNKLNKFSLRKSKSFDSQSKFFNKKYTFFVQDLELMRYNQQNEYENDLLVHDLLIKNTVSKVFSNLYNSLGESDIIEKDNEKITFVKKDNYELKPSKVGKNDKRKNKKQKIKNNIDNDKTDIDTEHSKITGEKFKFYENTSKNLIEYLEIEKFKLSKSSERNINCLNLNKPDFGPRQEDCKQIQIIPSNETDILKKEQETIVKKRNKSKKKKHRNKYKTNNNNLKNLQNSKKQECDLQMDLRKKENSSNSNLIIENKPECEKKDTLEQNKIKNVVSKNLDISIVSEKEKINNVTEINNNQNYISYKEDYKLGKSYGLSYNKFNNFGNINNSFQYFNNRNINYNRYLEESSMITSNYNSMNNFNILQKIEGFYPNFFFNLHNDLLEYSNSINEINIQLKEIKLYSITYVENVIKSILNSNIIIDIYGSFATDLCIETSDIDLILRIIDPNINYSDELFSKLCQEIEKLKVFDSVNPILTASVPILKLVIDPRNILVGKSLESYDNFLSSNLYKNYQFKKEELLKIKIDVNLTNGNSKTFSTYSSVEWAKNQIINYPEIKILLQYLKRFLQIHKLNSSFNGGLSSYSLLLILVAYVKYSKTIYIFDLGHLLTEFFEFFGKFFDFKCGVIDVNQANPILRYNNVLEVYPCILDPITYLNVAKNSFRINEIIDLFAKSFDFINQIKIKFDKNEIKEKCLFSILNICELNT